LFFGCLGVERINDDGLGAVAGTGFAGGGSVMRHREIVRL